MSGHQEASPTEQFAGHGGTQLALTGLASLVASPGEPLVALAALLPVLASTLAGGRHKERTEAFMADISATLKEHEAKLKQMSDAQYKLLNETILSVFQTTHSEKIQILKQVVRNSIELNDLDDQTSVFLSRVVRDISVEEVRLLKATFAYPGILLYGPPFGLYENTFRIDPNSADALAVAGLLSLGLLVPSGTVFGGPPVLEFTRGAGKLMTLLADPKSDRKW